ncbi:uncharacterized protein I303_103881 [Kwoniella dejecticola CBS 10117]|uniref:Protein CPL1-like domain-containing protein n=1 Tax=Kwoniella dejecticola CBS 10117 TaxID=1296121 RepID=A0A1A6A800_9TREE|nr:uncharacterized protein I303_03900 [Kwoniella dejecticola CBS 10117]OBR86180.1 hypothetical protein I303_03900 [Kwoniella dejecticola CBS 10117]
MLPTIVVFALATLIPVVVDAQAYVGCFNPDVIEDVPGDRVLIDLNESKCVCSVLPPSGDELHPAYFSEGFPYPYWSVTLTRPFGDYQWSGCWVLPPGIGQWANVASFAQCFEECVTSDQSLAYTQYVGETVQCICTNSYPPIDLPLQCAQETPFLYYRNVQPSSFVKRQLRSRLARDDQMVLGHCPKGLTACNTAQDGLHYECIDIDSEIESCGACLYGEYGVENIKDQENKGVDCTTLPGVLLGGVTCNAGRCVASLCDDAHRLELGTCLAK